MQTHLGIHDNVIVSPQIPKECDVDRIVSTSYEGGDSCLIPDGQPLAVYSITKHRVGSGPGDERGIILPSLDGQGNVFYFTIGKSALDNLLYLTMTDGYVEFVLVDVQELCSLSEQLLKLGPFDGTVNSLINVGNRCQSDEMRAARFSLTSASHSRQEQVQ